MHVAEFVMLDGAVDGIHSGFCGGVIPILEDCSFRAGCYEILDNLLILCALEKVRELVFFSGSKYMALYFLS